MSTLTELITRVTERLSMASGAGVQVYAEDRIAEMIQYQFDVLFDEAFWPQFCSWQSLPLDGTLGIVTTDLTNLVKRPEDFQFIYRENTSTKLTELNAEINPFELSGTTAMFYEQLGPLDDNKVSRVLQFWPKAATGNLITKIRTKPDKFVAEDVIDFDDQVLILGATFDYLEDDGTNSNATAKFEKMYTDRKAQIHSNKGNTPFSLDGRTTDPNQFTFTAL